MGLPDENESLGLPQLWTHSPTGNAAAVDQGDGDAAAIDQGDPSSQCRSDRGAQALAGRARHSAAARCPCALPQAADLQRQPRLWCLALRHSDHGTARLEPTLADMLKAGLLLADAQLFL